MAAPTARSRAASSKGGSSAPSLLLLALLGVAAAIIAAALSPYPKPAAWESTATTITLADGRSLAYQVSGSAAGNFTLLYLPRTSGSRLESAVLDPAVLQELSIRVISVDRPGNGQSSPHANRTFTSFADDVSQLAVALKLEKLLVAATSSGAPYALALSALLPERVMGSLLLSPLSSAADLSVEEKAALGAAPGRYPGSLQQLLLAGPAGGALVAAAQLPAVSWALYKAHLAGKALSLGTAFDAADEECLGSHPEVSAAFSEGLLQQSGAAFVADLAALLAPLPFNLSTLGPLHILAAAQDPIAPTLFAQSIAAKLPGASLRIVEAASPGHLSWWLCDAALQREVLGSLVAAACADGDERCLGWAATGECSKNSAFMGLTCKKSCGFCGLTDASIKASAEAAVKACVDSVETCPGWAASGECEKNSAFMHTTCKKSCNQC